MVLTAFAGCASQGTPAPEASQEAPAPSQGAGVQEGMDVDVQGDVAGQAGQQEGKVYNFAIIYGGVHPFFDPWRFGAQQAALDLGIPTPNVTSPQNWDQTQQNAIIDGLVAGGVNGIGMFTSDAVAGNEKITELVGMGIPVVTMGGSPATPSKATLCYTTDVGASVAYATQAIIDKLKADGMSEGKLMHLCSGLADTNTQKRQAAIKEVLAKPENAGFTLEWELAARYATERTEPNYREYPPFSGIYWIPFRTVSGDIEGTPGALGAEHGRIMSVPVSETERNDLGFYGFSGPEGKLWQWCNDYLGETNLDTYHVKRGGSRYPRCNPNYNWPKTKWGPTCMGYDQITFRVARSILGP